MHFVHILPDGYLNFSFSSVPLQGLCTLLFISYVTQFYVISPWMPFNTFWGAFHSTTFLAIVSVVIWCYFKATTTDPGSVQKNTATVDDIWAPASDPER